MKLVEEAGHSSTVFPDPIWVALGGKTNITEYRSTFKARVLWTRGNLKLLLIINVRLEKGRLSCVAQLVKC